MVTDTGVQTKQQMKQSIYLPLPYNCGSSGANDGAGVITREKLTHQLQVHANALDFSSKYAFHMSGYTIAKEERCGPDSFTAISAV